MWTPEESQVTLDIALVDEHPYISIQRIVGIARETVPELKTFSLPYGLQVENGPDAVVEYIKKYLPTILGS